MKKILIEIVLCNDEEKNFIILKFLQLKFKYLVQFYIFRMDL